MFGPEPPGGTVRNSQGLDQNVEPGGTESKACWAVCGAASKTQLGFAPVGGDRLA